MLEILKNLKRGLVQSKVCLIVIFLHLFTLGIGRIHPDEGSSYYHTDGYAVPMNGVVTDNNTNDPFSLIYNE